MTNMVTNAATFSIFVAVRTATLVRNGTYITRFFKRILTHMRFRTCRTGILARIVTSSKRISGGILLRFLAASDAVGIRLFAAATAAAAAAVVAAQRRLCAQGTT